MQQIKDYTSDIDYDYSKYSSPVNSVYPIGDLKFDHQLQITRAVSKWNFIIKYFSFTKPFLLLKTNCSIQTGTTLFWYSSYKWKISKTRVNRLLWKICSFIFLPIKFVNDL